MMRLLRRPETIAAVLLCIAFGVGAKLSPYFLDAHFLFDSTSQYMEIGIMALAMTLVIISGNIDLSVASGSALVCVTSAMLYSKAHFPMPVVMIFALLMGIALGLFNGLLIAKLRLPSLIVTLGTLALYRGIAQVMAGDHSIGGFPDWFIGINQRKIGDLVPMPLVIFLVLAAVFAVLLHKTVFGRCVYAIGTNEPAARFSGLQTDRVKITIFALSGLTMGIGAMMMLSRLYVARYNLAAGDELTVITAVVLGGTDIFGGRGSIIGTVIALFLLGILKRGMGVADITAEKQLAVTGTVLVVAVILANLVNKFGAAPRKIKPSEPPVEPIGGDQVHA
jgi:rhamnose transport system permease protein